MAQVPEGATLPSAQQSAGALPRVEAQGQPDFTVAGVLGKFGEGLGQAGQQLSDAFAKHAIEIQQLNNQASSDTAYQGYLKDTGDLEAKFQLDNRKVDPNHASEIYGAYVDKLEQIRQQYRGTLGNPMAQSMYDQQSRRMQGYMMQNGSKTVSVGGHEFRYGAFLGTQATLEAKAAASKDPAEQEDIKQQIANNTYAWGKSEGSSEEELKGDVLKATSRVDVSIIGQRMATYPEGAKVYYDAHKGEITPEHQAALEDSLDKALGTHGAVYAAAAGMASIGAGPMPPGMAAPGPTAANIPPGTPHGGLSAQMAGVESAVTTAFPGSRVSGEGRTAAQNAKVGGTADSAHLIGPNGANAIDIHPPPGVSGPAFAAQIREKFPGVNAVYEGPGAKHSTAPHVHVQLGTQGLASGYSPGSAGAALDHIQGNSQAAFAATDKAADAYAAKWGLDPVMVRYQAEQKLEGDMNRQEYQFRQQEDSSRQNLLTALSTPDANGDRPGSMPELLKLHPDLQGDVKNLTGSDLRMVDGQFKTNANEITPHRQQQWEDITGRPASEIMQLNPLDHNLDLATTQRSDLITLKNRLTREAAHQQEHDAQIHTITSNPIVHAGLISAGLLDTTGRPSNDQDYNVFLGRALKAEQDWMAQHPDHKGPIPPQDLIDLVTPLYARRGAHPGIPIMTPFGLQHIPWTGSAGEQPPIIPPERYEQLRQQYRDTHGGQDPDPEQIGREYQIRKSKGLEQ